MNSLLRLENIHKHFGGVYALRGVDLEVHPGEIHALIGENGAGKSTLGKIIAGVVLPDEGNIIFKDMPVQIHHPLDAQRLGISIIFQELDLFPDLTVAENIVVGNLKIEKTQFVDPERLESYCAGLMERVELTCDASTVLRDLSIGEMQKVAIARALSLNADLIVMDEPTSALSDEAVEVLFELIRKLKETGVAIIFVSHKMREIFEIADRITVLRDGAKIGTLQAAETSNKELIKMMVGRDVSGIERSVSAKSPDVLLSARNLTTQKLHDISFELHKGEVLGIAGLVGAGRSELGAALFGLDEILSGEILLEGEPVDSKNPRSAIDHHFGLLPEDRKSQGLLMDMSVRENASLSMLNSLQRFGVIDEKQEYEAIQTIHDQVALKTSSADAKIQTLSGGNQQKVLLARWLLVNPKVLFLDDPTRGIDIGAKEDIYHIIENLAAEGKGILLVSSELPELLRCCDRIMVFHEGNNMGIFPSDEVSQEQIMELATHTLAES